jgi:hypothetical protein
MRWGALFAFAIGLGGAAVFLSMRGPRGAETRTEPDLLLAPENPATGDLRLRVRYVRRGRSVEGTAWTYVGCRFEGSAGSLPSPPPLTFVGGNLKSLVLGSGAEVKTYPLSVYALTGEFEIHCGPAAGETSLREAAIEVNVRPGAAWDTTTFTLAKGATIEKDLGDFKIRFGPSPIDPDRQLDETRTMSTIGSFDALMDIRDQVRPLLGMGGWAREAGMRVDSCWWADSRRDLEIEFPVTISIHRPRKAEEASKEKEVPLRFVIRDLPLGRAP